MVRTNQGGSVLRFIVIGVVLTILLSGGAYVVRRQTAQPSLGRSTEITSKPATDQSQDKKSSDQPPQTNNHTDNASPNTQSAPAVGESSPAALPQTGPIETISTFVALGFLSVTCVSYVRSRRPELSL